MTAALIEQPAAQLTVRREINATAEELFDAFLDADSLGEFMRPGSERHSDVTVDPRVGGSFSINMHIPGKDHLHTGEFREIDRPRTLVFTWVSESTQQRESIVTVRFNPVPGAQPRTEVVLTHVLLPESQVKGHTAGWTGIIGLLAARYHIAS
jgi:uncharacterized protein YndB with AHSA1/START domain